MMFISCPTATVGETCEEWMQYAGIDNALIRFQKEIENEIRKNSEKSS
jgi:hypothetical protein